MNLAGEVGFSGTATKAIPESDEVDDVSLGLGGKGFANLGFTREDDRVHVAAWTAGPSKSGAPIGPASPVAGNGVAMAGTDAPAW